MPANKNLQKRKNNVEKRETIHRVGCNDENDNSSNNSNNNNIILSTREWAIGKRGVGMGLLH